MSGGMNIYDMLAELEARVVKLERKRDGQCTECGKFWSFHAWKQRDDGMHVPDCDGEPAT